MKTQGFHHVAVQVRNLAAAEFFYVQVLGLPLIRRWSDAQGDDRSLWLDVGQGSVLMLERAGEEGTLPSAEPFVSPHAGWHVISLGIEVGERPRWLALFEARGVEVVHRTRYTLYVRDPEGNRVGLSHYPHESLPEVSS